MSSLTRLEIDLRGHFWKYKCLIFTLHSEYYNIQTILPGSLRTWGSFHEAPLGGLGNGDGWNVLQQGWGLWGDTHTQQRKIIKLWKAPKYTVIQITLLLAFTTNALLLNNNTQLQLVMALWVLSKCLNLRLACAVDIQQSWFHKRWLDHLKPPKQLCHEHQVVILWKYSNKSNI